MLRKNLKNEKSVTSKQQTKNIYATFHEIVILKRTLYHYENKEYTPNFIVKEKSPFFRFILAAFYYK